MDADVILMEDTLKTMLADFLNSNYISMRAQESPDRKCSNYWEWARLQQQPLRPGEHLSTCTGLFRRETILKYGFDPSAEHLDDIDLEFRLRKRDTDLAPPLPFSIFSMTLVCQALLGEDFSMGGGSPEPFGSMVHGMPGSGCRWSPSTGLGFA